MVTLWESYNTREVEVRFFLVTWDEVVLLGGQMRLDKRAGIWGTCTGNTREGVVTPITITESSRPDLHWHTDWCWK